MISGLDRSKDNLIRKVNVKYRNANETQDRETERSVRKLCKLWSEDDWNLQDDLADLAERLKGVVGEQVIVDQVQLAHLGAHHVSAPQAQAQAHSDGCCCSSHCHLNHEGGTTLRDYQGLNTMTNLACDLEPQLPCFKAMSVEFMGKKATSYEPAMDNLSDYLMNFNLS